MSEVVNNSEVPDSRQTVTSSDAAAPGVGGAKPKVGGRRGGGSKNKRFIKMRKDKNEGAEVDRFNNLVNKYDLGSEVHGYCTAMLVGAGSSHPSRIVNIKCDNVVPELVLATTVFLESRKLQLPETASADLENVLRLQIRAKENLARRGTGKARPEDYTAVGVERTIKHLNRAPHGIALYLSNIGRVDYRGQKIFPVSDIPGPAPPDTIGMSKTTIMNAEGKRMYVLLTIAGRQLYPPNHILSFEEVSQPGIIQRSLYAHDAFDSLDALVNRYHVLLNMIERKFSYLVDDIDFADAIGTTAQLVGTTLLRDETYTAHCTVPIVDHMLAIGAGCKFGLDSDDPYHNMDNAYVLRDTNPGNFFTEIQDKKRPPRVEKDA